MIFGAALNAAGLASRDIIVTPNCVFSRPVERWARSQLSTYREAAGR